MRPASRRCGATPGFGRCRLVRSPGSAWDCRCYCSFICSGFRTISSHFMAVGESFPGSSPTFCAIPGCPGCRPWPRPLLPLGISAHTAIVLLLSRSMPEAYSSLALGFHTRLSAFLAWGLHLSLVTSGFASFYGVDQLANTFLFYLVLFPSGRAWTFAPRPASRPRGDDSRRLSEGDAVPPLRDLSRRRVGQSHGETVVERRGHLADGLSARVSARSISAGWRGTPGSQCSPAGPRWWWRSATCSSSGHAARGGRGASRRSACTSGWRCSWGSSSSRA